MSQRRFFGKIFDRRSELQVKFRRLLNAVDRSGNDVCYFWEKNENLLNNFARISKITNDMSKILLSDYEVGSKIEKIRNFYLNKDNRNLFLDTQENVAFLFEEVFSSYQDVIDTIPALVEEDVSDRLKTVLEENIPKDNDISNAKRRISTFQELFIDYFPEKSLFINEIDEKYIDAYDKFEAVVNTYVALTDFIDFETKFAEECQKIDKDEALLIIEAERRENANKPKELEKTKVSLSQSLQPPKFQTNFEKGSYLPQVPHFPNLPNIPNISDRKPDNSNLELINENEKLKKKIQNMREKKKGFLQEIERMRINYNKASDNYTISIKECHDLTIENSKLTTTNLDLTKTCTELKSANAKLNQSIEELNKELNQTITELNSVNEKLVQSSDNNSENEEKRLVTEKIIHELKDSNAQLQEQNKELIKKYHDLHLSSEETNQSIKEHQSEIEKLLQVSYSNTDNEKLIHELRNSNTELQEKYESLNQLYQQIKIDYQNLSQEKHSTKLKKELQRLKEVNKRLTNEINDLNNMNSQLQNEIRQLREEKPNKIETMKTKDLTSPLLEQAEPDTSLKCSCNIC
ncbi:hypothetical protein TRFO_05177 [Tritrichomonas foetus]|uniref:Uncharacterized protein n=1 Tax=Tritrichomonas foetus TaxID=1144522 RepID=A0A1J4K7T8_9EUKA|nr:hypothetical protein TRFO_05177 [Tritrichomonas foetus]|eukprot:OHT07545.1 hypothetical protein TRFO_05177 [Tritrichomonas foetus]